MRSANGLAHESASNPLLLAQLLVPVVHILDNYVRNVHRGGSLDDQRFIRLGVLRVLSQATSGRDFLQSAREIHGEDVARSSFFDSFNSVRRRDQLAEINAQIVLRNLSAQQDLLAAFPELRDVPIFAVDGHHVEHAVHSPDGKNGAKVSSSNLYLLCLHSALLWNLGAVQGDGHHAHEMPVFRRRIEQWLSAWPKRGKGPPPIFVGDPAFVDNAYWSRMEIQGRRARFITRTKSNMKPILYGTREWDRGSKVNEGVVDDLSAGFDGALTMRIVRYRDPETGCEYEFLTSVMDLEPGLIAMLYLTRWRIEKVFDTTKNKLEETKSWAVGPVAQDMRAHLVALTHNLLVLLRSRLEREHGIREGKVERKRVEATRCRERRAREVGRKVAWVQRQMPPVVQLTAQFIRSVRNAILVGMRWIRALDLLRAATEFYL